MYPPCVCPSDAIVCPPWSSVFPAAALSAPPPGAPEPSALAHRPPRAAAAEAPPPHGHTAAAARAGAVRAQRLRDVAAGAGGAAAVPRCSPARPCSPVTRAVSRVRTPVKLGPFGLYSCHVLCCPRRVPVFSEIFSLLTVSKYWLGLGLIPSQLQTQHRVEGHPATGIRRMPHVRKPANVARDPGVGCIYFTLLLYSGFRGFTKGLLKPEWITTPQLSRDVFVSLACHHVERDTNLIPEAKRANMAQQPPKNHLRP